MKIVCVQMNPTIGDLEGNTEKVLSALERARKAKAEVVLFPELTLTGYPPEDLLLDPSFVEAAEERLEEIASATRGFFVAVGLPRQNRSGVEKPLYNSAAVFIDGKLVGFKDKTLLPTYDVFDERRFFEPGSEEQTVWSYRGKTIAVTICEDLWQCSHQVGYTNYRTDPVLSLQKKQPDFVLNLSSSPYYFGKRNFRVEIYQPAARSLRCPVILCNQVGANDELVFDGHSFCLNEKGELTQIAKGFVEEDFFVEVPSRLPCLSLSEESTEHLYSALVLGTRDYFRKQGFRDAVLGLSGGIDSAVTACIAVEALGAAHVMGLSLPTRFSSQESRTDAQTLAKHLGIECKTIEIDSLFQNYLDLLQPFFQGRPTDITEENLQSRIRAMILMAFSNKLGSILLTTGNKSEMAMGYTTLYGDMAGGLAPLHDVVKLQIYELARYINRKREVIPQTILEKEPSAELKPKQKTTDVIHPFEVLDPVIQDYIEHQMLPEEIARKRGIAISLIEELVHRFHFAEYKRRQAPISIRVTPKAFSKGRNVPIVQRWK